MRKRLYALSVLAVIFAVGSIKAQQSWKVYLQSGVMTPSANFTSVLAQDQLFDPTEVVNGNYYRLLQFEQIPDAQTLTILKNQRIDVLAYIDYAAYVVAIPVQTTPEQLKSLPLRSILPLQPEWKLGKGLKEQPYPVWAWNGEDLAVILSLQKGIQIEQAKNQLASMGLRVEMALPDPAVIYTSLKPADLDRVAALPIIAFIEMLPPIGIPEDDKGRALHRANLVDSESAIGPKYTGNGISVLVRDDGAVGPHIDFQGRLTNIATNYGPTHGDGVSGIFAGAGNLDPDKRGMAAGAELYVVNYVNHFQDQTLPLHLDNGVKVTNSSYSDGCNTGYTTATRTVDKQIFENPTLMHVFSAGNSNNTECDYGAGLEWGNITGGHKQAKNAIAVANLNQNAGLENTSSRGPAYDGRLKPDISANGAGHLSTDEANTYLTFGGTSGAAPGIAGIIAQLMEAYKTQNAGAEPAAGLIKAALLNTTNDQGNPGPDFKYGWGHVHAGRALNLLQENRYATGSVAQGEDKAYEITVPQGAINMRVMVYWPEKESASMAAKALINDLDIRILGPDQTVHLPWKLNPTADAAILNLPAGRGRDSLNNTEQVFIDLPNAGIYTLYVKGQAVPLGSVNYFIVYDFATDAIRLTYPNGGEGLAHGQSVNIQWDALGETGSFDLAYSTDQGSNWTPIATALPSARLRSWTVPSSVTSGKMLISVTRSGVTDISDTTFTVSRAVAGFELVKACPDSVTVKWRPMADTISYEVFALGAKYMDSKGISSDTFLTFPYHVTADPLWLSIRPLINGTAPGRRLNAIQYPGNLINCPQNVDYEAYQLESPSGGAVLACDPGSKSVSLRINNAGLQSIQGVTASYSLNNGVPVTEPIPDLQPSISAVYTFAQPLQFPANGEYTLKTWVKAPGEQVFYNDTLTSQVVYIAQQQNGFFTEDFENQAFPPDGWRVRNPDAMVTWDQATNIIGASGTITKAAYVDHFNYDDRTQSDGLYLIPLDLTGLTKATLSFDLANARYSTTYTEGLAIEVYKGCALNGSPDTVFRKTGTTLATRSNQTTRFAPTQAAHWRKELVNLDEYLGGNIILAFVAKNDNGNNTYIDNIQLSDAVIPPPVASFTMSIDTVCRLDTVYFAANGVGDTFTWNFGSGVLPSSTATGAGPHARTFTTNGDRIIRLVTNNQGGSDTAFQILNVKFLPTANFTSAANQNTVVFNNTSTNAQSVLWDFGDGSTSTEYSTSHTYASVGTYNVTLTINNVCKTVTKVAQVTISTVGTDDPTTSMKARILPNPNSGQFSLDLEQNSAADLQVSIFAADGRLIANQTAYHQGGRQIVPLNYPELPSGVYQLEIRQAEGVTRLQLVVEK